jgi:hypothetical protein
VLKFELYILEYVLFSLQVGKTLVFFILTLISLVCFYFCQSVLSVSCMSLCKHEAPNFISDLASIMGIKVEIWLA